MLDVRTHAIKHPDYWDVDGVMNHAVSYPG
jgi:hypothetical protein